MNRRSRITNWWQCLAIIAGPCIAIAATALIITLTRGSHR